MTWASATLGDHSSVPLITEGSVRRSVRLGPVKMPWLERADAVIAAWYPGARGGEAPEILGGQIRCQRLSKRLGGGTAFFSFTFQPFQALPEPFRKPMHIARGF